MRKVLPIPIIMVFLIIFTGCELFQSIKKQFSEMGHKERLTWLMSVYNTEYDSYLGRVTSGVLISDAEKTVLRAKRQALVVAWKAINTYQAIVDRGLEDNVKGQEAYNVVVELLGFATGGRQVPETP